MLLRSLYSLVHQTTAMISSFSTRIYLHLSQLIWPQTMTASDFSPILLLAKSWPNARVHCGVKARPWALGPSSTIFGNPRKFTVFPLHSSSNFHIELWKSSKTLRMNIEAGEGQCNILNQLNHGGWHLPQSLIPSFSLFHTSISFMQ